MGHFFAYINRTKLIKRWGLMRNTETESLSEHLYETALLAHALAVIQNTKFGDNVNADKIAVAALYHDASEIITGDLPTPVKYYNDEIKSAYQKIEAETREMLISKLPDFLKDIYSDILSEEILTEKEKLIVKTADTLSAYLKCIEEQKAGNHDFEGAAEGIKKKLDSNSLPALKYFIEEFLDSYTLSIDELK